MKIYTRHIEHQTAAGWVVVAEIRDTIRNVADVKARAAHFAALRGGHRGMIRTIDIDQNEITAVSTAY